MEKIIKRLGDERLWDVLANELSQSEKFRELEQAAVDARKRLTAAEKKASIWIPLSSFPGEIKCRAGNVYKKVFGSDPRKRITSFLQGYNPEWEMYPDQAKILREIVGEENPKAVVERLRAELQAADHELREFKEGLIVGLWEQGIQAYIGSERYIPVYKNERPEFAETYQGFVSGSALELERPEKPPTGSPVMLAGLREKVKGRPLRIYYASGIQYSLGGCSARVDSDISLGEIGRGRKHTVIPIAGRKSGEAVKAVQLEIKGSLVILKASEESAAEDFVLMVLDITGGCRGSVEYRLPEGSVVLASGHNAQGQAGRAGGWDELLVLVPAPSEVIYFTTGGGGHIGGPGWFLIASKDSIVHENDSRRKERLAREAADKGDIEWL